MKQFSEEWWYTPEGIIEERIPEYNYRAIGFVEI